MTADIAESGVASLRNALDRELAQIATEFEREFNFGPQPSGQKSGGQCRSTTAAEDDVMLNVAETEATTKKGRARSSGISTLFPAIRYGGTRTISAEDWTKVRDNPRQRDTERHAKNAHHLAAFHAAHCKVNAAQLPDGTIYKLDGHTRAFLWGAGKLTPPDAVFMDIWLCGSLESVKDLYETFDNKAAVETATDQVAGGLREHDVSFESELLRSQRIASGLRTAYEIMFGQIPARSTSMYELIKFWRAELLILDKCMPTRKRFDSGVLAGALIAIARYDEAAKPFFIAFATGAGSKIDGELDAVQALEERMLRRKAEGKISGRGHLASTVSMVLSAYDRNRRGVAYSRDSSGIKSLKATTLAEWIKAAKAAKATRAAKAKA